MLKKRVIGGLVEGNEEGPAPPVTAVLVTLVEEVTMEEQGISCP